MPTRSMVHETASFYWHGIQSVPLGYMSLALQRGQLIKVHHAPASILQPNPFNARPPPPRCHSCINTIGPVKNAGMLAIIHYCLWLIMQSDRPLVLFEFKWSWPRASRPSQILPIFSPHAIQVYACHSEPMLKGTSQHQNYQYTVVVGVISVNCTHPGF